MIEIKFKEMLKKIVFNGYDVHYISSNGPCVWNVIDDALFSVDYDERKSILFEDVIFKKSFKFVSDDSDIDSFSMLEEITFRNCEFHGELDLSECFMELNFHNCKIEKNAIMKIVSGSITKSIFCSDVKLDVSKKLGIDNESIFDKVLEIVTSANGYLEFQTLSCGSFSLRHNSNIQKTLSLNFRDNLGYIEIQPFNTTIYISSTDTKKRLMISKVKLNLQGGVASLTLENILINKLLIIENCSSFSFLTLVNIFFDKSSSVDFQHCDFSNSSFIHVDFKYCKIFITYCDFLKSKLIGVLWPTKLSDYVIQNYGEDEVYSRLKQNYLLQGASSQALVFHLLEMNSLQTILKEKKSYSDLFILLMSKYFSRHGTSWLIPLSWIFLINIVVAVSVGYNEGILKVFDLFSILVNPFFLVKSEVFPIHKFLLLILTILNSFLTFQLIQSFRKFNRKF